MSLTTNAIMASFIVGFSALGMVPSGNPDVMGRIVQLEGQASSVSWDTGSPDLVLSDISEVPQGIVITIDAGIVTFNLPASSVVSVPFTISLSAYTTPPLDNWQGPVMEMNYAVPLEWHVISQSANPFLNGMGDIVATPVP